jgi:hypothetical protein
MLAFDLTNTPLAASTELVVAPKDYELCGILNALLVVERCSFSRLAGRQLRLHDGNLDEVARVLHRHFPLLYQRAAGECGVRASLAWLCGLSVARFPLEDEPEHASNGADCRQPVERGL